MKKEYMKPAIEATQITPANIICGSASENYTFGFGGSVDQPEESTYLDFNGIWGD